MSITSTTYSRHTKRRDGQKENGRERATANSERSRNFTEEDRKWSSNKLKHELSSFIAEFSYLTSTTNKSQNNTSPKNQTNINKPHEIIQIYAAKGEQSGTPFQSPESKRRGVEWKDNQSGAIVYSVQDATDCDKPKGFTRFRRKVIKRSPKIKMVKSCSTRRSTSREHSCHQQTRPTRRVRRRFSGFRASKSRCQRRRARSCRSETPIRRRVRSHGSCVRKRSRTPSVSRSYVTYMPIRVGRRRTREIVIKRSKPKIVYKTIEPCDEPTLVTLFPQPIKRRPHRVLSKEPVLPCKCDMCTNKYKSLARLKNNPRLRSASPPVPPVRALCPPFHSPCPPCDPCAPVCAPCPPVCAPCPPVCGPCRPMCAVYPLMGSSCPRRYRPCSPNWYCNTDGMYRNRLWANQCCKQDYCRPIASRCEKRVSFKFGNMGQCLDSNITHYFRSILDGRACC